MGWLVGWFSVLYSYTESEEELKKNLLRRKHTLRGVKGSEASEAKSPPQQRKMHSSEDVGGVGLPTHTGCAGPKDRGLLTCAVGQAAALGGTGRNWLAVTVTCWFFIPQWKSWPAVRQELNMLSVAFCMVSRRKKGKK